MIPNTLLQVAASALPVPLCGVGNSSGVNPYSTAYMMLLKKLKAHCQPSRDVLLDEVVEQ